ncbi:hypothetical protein [Streptomyces sp. cg35]|uniref:hypothetical protein n=1 Tax=Streptomyces sp. cg35 TaxID=3421650 RepID=UPI003D18020A
MRHTAEQARHESRFLLRGQALHLSEYDTHPDTGNRLAHQQPTERPGDRLAL